MRRQCHLSQKQSKLSINPNYHSKKFLVKAMKRTCLTAKTVSLKILFQK